MNEDTDEALVEEIPSEIEDSESGVVPIYRIVSYPADYTLWGLYEKWTQEEFIIPPFQRRPVWTHTQKSKLIDSFLLGLPVPSIFLYKEMPSEKHLVIDGHQRLLTVCSFFDGKFPDPDGKPFFLKGVNEHWDGNLFTDLNKAQQRRLRDCVLRAIIVDQLDPKDDSSIYHIFERLNTGGTTLTPQEVRNCIYHGPFNDLVIRLNQSQTWRNILDKPKPDPRMRDVELIVRFLALFENSDSYTKPMKGFLNDFMAKHKHEPNTEQYEKVFATTAENVVKSLGPRPFHIRGGTINAAAIDCVMVAFARSGCVPKDAQERYDRLKVDDEFKEATTSGTSAVDNVQTRLRLAREFLFNCR